MSQPAPPKPHPVSPSKPEDKAAAKPAPSLAPNPTAPPVVETPKKL